MEDNSADSNSDVSSAVPGNETFVSDSTEVLPLRVNRTPTGVQAREVLPEANLDDPQLYFNRELSHLQFNIRVLEQALALMPGGAVGLRGTQVRLRLTDARCRFVGVEVLAAAGADGGAPHAALAGTIGARQHKDLGRVDVVDHGRFPEMNDASATTVA